MTSKCVLCGLFYKKQSMHSLSCQNHFICKPCFNLNEVIGCRLCESIAAPPIEPKRQSGMINNYPIQGIMVYYDKHYNPEGESQFSSLKNCHQRTAGWIMCNFLGLVFFFSGLAMAIRTSQLGLGVILTIVGIIGMVVSLYFICKIRKVDRHYDSIQYINQDNFIHLKKNRRTISSVNSDKMQQIQMIGTKKQLVSKN